MKKQQQKESLFKNPTLDSFMKDGQLYTLEQRSDKLYLIRCGYKTLSMSVLEEEARKRFDNIKIQSREGVRTI